MKYLRCPLCHQSLVENIHGLACPDRHQFDRAKEGYFNLLPVHFKHSLEPGDAKAQLQARRSFLREGFFSTLKNELQQLLPPTTNSFLDIGCGEGYFTSSFAEALPNAQAYGFDIAKAGIRLAAKAALQQQQKIVYGVASSFDLPLQDETMDVITRIYAPSKDEELQRVIRPDGLLIIVSPGEQHLLGLRQQIYANVKPHLPLRAPAGFSEVEQRTVNSSLNLPSGEFCAALLEMTPFAWRITPELRRRLIHGGMKDTLEFNINMYRRHFG